jgi:NO-binding membrane sensor protein with MHYT domain
VGSVLIACTAVVIGLYIMFIILRPKLQHGWPLKVMVALVLGLAVCLMHYVAMVGELWPRLWR